jgi:hypothetical protein
MVPFVEVSHLASSTSFYSAVLQPLGLRYIPPPAEERGTVAKLSSSSAAFGSGDDISLELYQSENPLKPPKLSSLVISAPSASAVAGFHSAWRKADPPLWSTFRDKRGLEKHFGDLDTARAGPWQSSDPRSSALVTSAVVYDLDGNRCEVVHHQHQHQHHLRNPPTLSQRDPSPPSVLEWTYDVQSTLARAPSRISLRKNSNSNSSRPSAMAPSQHDSPFSSVGGRSSHGPLAAAGTDRSAPTEALAEESVSPRQSSRQGGLNTTTVVGALLGAAAGAALTYGIVSNVRGPAQDQPEQPRAPPRRATFPDKPVTSQRRQSYHETGVIPVDDYRDRKTPRKLAYPDIQTLSLRGGGTYYDGDEDVDYGKNPWVESPRYLTQGPSAQSVITKSRPPSTYHPVEDTYDGRSRHSSRHHGGRAASVRSRSETARDRIPVGVTDDDSRSRHRPAGRSVAGEPVGPSRPPMPPTSRSVAGGPVASQRSRSRSRRSSVYHAPEYGTYVTAQTHRSSDTMRQPNYEYGGWEAMPRSRAPSQVSTSTVRKHTVPRDSHSRGHPLPPESRVSAKRVPLPRSGVGSSHANWEPRDVPLPMSGVGSSHANWDDDMESLAPSDSISCVGSKHSRRTRRYHQ